MKYHDLENDRLIRALLREPVDKTPIWLMRQAGRYLPEYRELRAKAGSFMTLCQTPELACEATLQPLRRFDLDAAILFSDILTIPDAMGLGLYFSDDEGPCFKSPVRTLKSIEKLSSPNPEMDLSYVLDAIKLVQKKLGKALPLIGFSGSPWTLATYMVEGKSTKTFQLIKQLLFKQPEALHQLLDIVTRSVTDYLNAQINAGVHVVMIFDTWGGVLSTSDYQEFSLNYVKRVISGLIRQRKSEPIPVILFTKNGGQWLELMTECGCDALGVDWTLNMSLAYARVGHRVALQGNMDPALLFASPERIRQETASILKAYGAKTGHIFNLGHGVIQGTPPEHVAVLVDTVHVLSQRM